MAEVIGYNTYKVPAEFSFYELSRQHVINIKRFKYLNEVNLGLLKKSLKRH